MIVKNESRIISRLLHSVVPIIDTYCICDTGSTDTTKQVITDFFTTRGISGEIFDEPFQNFGYNRTAAMQRAAGVADYLLLLDADMVLVVSPDFKKGDLTEGAYQITQQGGTLVYYNTRLVKSTIGATCVGPTHEYYNIPAGYVTAKLPTLSIRDIGDGGAKADKFERDIRLLLGGLECEPRNGRYMFYLANSYRDNGKKEEAITWYQRRITVGGWAEEVWNSAYHMGTCYKDLKRDAEAVYWWLEAYGMRPGRAESIYQLTKHYRVTGKHALALQFYKLGSAIPFPKDDVLFIEKDVYEYLFDYEALVIAYYVRHPIDHRSILKLIGQNYCYENVMSNYLFYVPKLKGQTVPFTRSASRSVGGVEREFFSCNPSIVASGDGYLMNLRMANHKILPNGTYAVGEMDNKIVSYNVRIKLDAEFRTVEEFTFDVPVTETQYWGIEDIRMLGGKEVLYAGMTQDPVTKALVMGGGHYVCDGTELPYSACPSPTGRSCEKNWALFRTVDGTVRYVYEWSPFTVLDLSGAVLSRNPNVPAWFRHLRGSSCGVPWKGQLWFLTHLVAPVANAPRIYYHMIIVLDAVTLEYVRSSYLFQLEGMGTVEYALGLVVESDRVIISYSKMDREALIGVYPYGEFCFQVGL
jgi:glycosyltransferase involved in cell wall biosynthesis